MVDNKILGTVKFLSIARIYRMLYVARIQSSKQKLWYFKEVIKNQ